MHCDTISKRGKISIHAPRTGSDDMARRGCLGQDISIHAPRTGSDLMSCRLPPSRSHFNPRSPHGERLEQEAHNIAIIQFQSTLPARGATQLALALKTEFTYFNPRSPHGERQRMRLRRGWGDDISIHAPRTGSDNTIC